MNGPKDARRVAASDPAENVARRKDGLVEEVGDIVDRDVEQAEAVKQVGPVSRSGPPRDVVVDLSVRKGCGRADLCVQPRRGDGRHLGKAGSRQRVQEEN